MPDPKEQLSNMTPEQLQQLQDLMQNLPNGDKKDKAPQQTIFERVKDFFTSLPRKILDGYDYLNHFPKLQKVPFAGAGAFMLGLAAGNMTGIAVAATASIPVLSVVVPFVVPAVAAFLGVISLALAGYAAYNVFFNKNDAASRFDKLKDRILNHNNSEHSRELQAALFDIYTKNGKKIGEQQVNFATFVSQNYSTQHKMLEAISENIKEKANEKLQDVDKFKQEKEFVADLKIFCDEQRSQFIIEKIENFNFTKETREIIMKNLKELKTTTEKLSEHYEANFASEETHLTSIAQRTRKGWFYFSESDISLLATDHNSVSKSTIQQHKPSQSTVELGKIFQKMKTAIIQKHFSKNQRNLISQDDSRHPAKLKEDNNSAAVTEDINKELEKLRNLMIYGKEQSTANATALKTFATIGAQAGVNTQESNIQEIKSTMFTKLIAEQLTELKDGELSQMISKSPEEQIHRQNTK